MNKPKLSLAMIVRDEGERLAECLSSVRSVVDEIVVVDTGSQDDTVSVAERFGAKVGHFEWCDDFSAARNESLHLATGEWVLVLDADERLSEGDARKLRELADADRRVAYRMTTRNYGFDDRLDGWTRCDPESPEAQGFPGWHPSVKVRLFPNEPGIEFRGRIHELVRDSLIEKAIERVLCDVQVHHYGKAQNPGELDRKRSYYLDLGIRKVREHPDDAKSHFELGNQYRELGDTESAERCYRDALRLEPDSAIVLNNLAAICYDNGDHAAAAELYSRARDSAPENLQTRRNLATTYLALGRGRDALTEIDAALTLDPMIHQGLYIRAVALETAGRYLDAANAYGEALDGAPNLDEAGLRFANMCVSGGVTSAGRTILSRLREAHPDSAVIANTLGELEFSDGNIDVSGSLFETATKLDESVARYWNNLGVARIALNDLRGSLAAFKTCLSLDPRNADARANLAALKETL